MSIAVEIVEPSKDISIQEIKKIIFYYFILFIEFMASHTHLYIPLRQMQTYKRYNKGDIRY